MTEKEANIDQLKQDIKDLELEYKNQRSNRKFNNYIFFKFITKI